MPSFNTVNAADYGLIVLYFAIIVAVGVYSARKNKNTDDYFKAGGQVPWVLAGLSNWVSGFSAFMFVAAAGFTYRIGIGALLIFSAASVSYLVGYMYFARMWRRSRINSPLEFLTRRFSPSTTYFYSVTAIIPQIVGIGQGLYILCIFVSTALGFGNETFSIAGIELNGLQASVILVGTVMVLYTVIGGLWAAVLSDAVQSIIIIVMTVIIFPVSYAYLGEGSGIFAGIQRMIREVPPEYFTLQGQAAQPLFLVAYFISNLLGYNVAWHLVQRYYSVPDERSARKMALLCALLALFGPLLWVLPVMASRVIFPDIGALWPTLREPAEASYVSLAMLLLPHGLIGFVVSAVLSATLGQANDAFNWLAATTTRDVYVPLRRRFGGRVPSDRHQLRVAQLTMLIVGVFGILVALYIPRFGGAFHFALQYHSLLACFMMPVALGMVFRRTPWWSGIAACSASVAVALTLLLFGLWPEHSVARNVFSAVVTSALVFGLSAFRYDPANPRNAAMQALDRDLRTPVPDATGSRATGGLEVYGLIGTIALILGVVLIACTLLPSTELAPATHNTIAGVLLLAIGFGLRRLAANARPRSANQNSKDPS
jgi:solute:Na+ symporter, SSS family